MNSPEISIIIPLEFNRGIAQKSIKAWSLDQDIPRKDFAELILVGSHKLPQLNPIKFQDLCLPHDQFLMIDEEHDMFQVAAGAKVAKGKWLVFTEAHVIPYINSLRMILQTINEYPEWHGFSGASDPLVNDRFSEIEAKFYEAGLKESQQHPWRKVLDQCFVIKQEHYSKIGGFQGQFGHFAEWLLAIELHKNGMQIGYDPRFRIMHKYSGKFGEIEKFTRNFIAGEIKFHAQFHQSHVYKRYVLEPAEWVNRYKFDSQYLKKMFLLCFKFQDSITLRIKFLMMYLFYPQFIISYGRIKIFAKTMLVFFGKFFFNSKKLYALYNNLQVEIIQNERIICAHQSLRNSPRDNIIICGLHGMEQWNGDNFNWSEPIGMIILKLDVGKHTLSLKILPIISEIVLRQCRFFKNQKTLHHNFFPETNEIHIEFEVYDKIPTEIGFIVPQFQAKNDSRELGLPISDLSIITEKN